MYVCVSVCARACANKKISHNNVLGDFSWGKVNKCLFTTEPMTDTSKCSNKAEPEEPMSVPYRVAVIYRGMGDSNAGA